MAVRSYLLAGGACLLIVLSILAGRTRPVWRRLRRLRSGLLALAVLMGLGAALFPGLPGLPTTGPYDWAMEQVELTDAGREDPFARSGSPRRLPLTVYYPLGAEPGACPLVVFSHGGLSTRESNLSLYRELASHGYVVAAPDHPGHSLSAETGGRRVPIDQAYFKALMTEDSHRDIAGSVQCFREWMGLRSADLNFVIDSLQSGEGLESAAFLSAADPGRVAVMGHSLGGAAALAVARQRQDIAAVLALDAPFLGDITGSSGTDFTWDASPYACAILNIYSDQGMALVQTDHKYAQNRRYLINEGSVGYCHIRGSNHYTLTDLVRVSPLLCRVLGGPAPATGRATLEAVSRYSLEFLEKHVRQFQPG